MSYYGIILCFLAYLTRKNNGLVTGRDRARTVSSCSRSGQRNAMWRDMWSTVSWKYVTICDLSAILFVSVLPSTTSYSPK